MNEEQKPVVFSVLYVENHPWKEHTFLGVYSTLEGARGAVQTHMEAEKKRLPHARISEYDYQIFESELNSSDTSFAGP